MNNICSSLKILKPKNQISSLKCLSSISKPYHRFSLSLLERNPNHQTQFNQILSQSITSGLFNDPFVSSKILLNHLSHFPDLTFSHAIFSQIRNPNVFSFNFMLKSFSHCRNPEKNVTLYNQMVCSGILPDNYSFPFVLKACGRLVVLDKGQEVHCLSIKVGFEHDVFVQNALISMYSLFGNVERARKVFDSIQVLVRDVVSWNSMISGYLQSGCSFDALNVFVEMSHDSYVCFDEVTLVSVLSGCGNLGVLDLGRNVHGLIVKVEFALDVVLGTSLIDMYAKCGSMKDAQKVFDRIVDKNVVCWTSMIVGYTRLHLFKDAIELFRQMQLGGVIADAMLIASVISVCGHLGTLDQGRWLHTYCERNGIDMNLSVMNALIDMYSKCGDIDKAQEIFSGLSKRDVISWTSMISGLSMNGKSDEALFLFEQMEESAHVKPNEVTFLGVLSACCHSGIVDKGFHYLRSMTGKYNLVPRIEHFGCMVDLLGRASLLEEAENFIHDMPVCSDVVIWRSLLFACRNHGNIQLAELAANKINELEPSGSGQHVLLSNIFASVSRWRDVDRIRKGAAVRKAPKQPGCSVVEINGVVHEFFAADYSHNQSDTVYETVFGMNEVMQFEDFDVGVLLIYQ